MPPAIMASPEPGSEAAATPQRNSTTSKPSRSTAIATTTPRPASDFVPAFTAWPAARICTASSRPCRAIHTLCEVSIATATRRIAALNNSWPKPSTAAESEAATSASRHAPSTPAAAPPPIHQPRPAMPAVTAMTMPTISPASKTSRKTMRSAASTASLFYHKRAARLLMEVVEELVAPGRERAHLDHALAVGRDHFFDPQPHAFEFHGGGIEIAHPDGDRPVGGGTRLGWL